MSHSWKVGLFGWLRLQYETQLVEMVPRRKVASLLAYLAYYSEQTHSRDMLAERFWPDADSEAGRNSLRVTLSRLKQFLQGVGTEAATLLIVTRNEVRLDTRGFQSDVEEMRMALREAQRAGSSEDKYHWLCRAIEPYAGPLLPELDDDWICTERSVWTEHYLSSLQRLVHLSEQRQEWETALSFARRAVQVDPYREAAQRDVMRLYGMLNRPGAVAGHYERFVETLDMALGTQPEAQTRALVRSLIKVPREVRAGSDIPNAETRTGSTGIPNGPGSLPQHPRTRFYGRQEELAQLEMWLLYQKEPLVIVSGPGGVGKTRLALEFAFANHYAFKGGIFFLSLADLRDPEAIPFQVLSAFTHNPVADQPALEQIVEFLSLRQDVLLVLDNIDPLLEEVGVLAMTLLNRVPEIQILATSRQRLNFSEGQELNVEPLAVPLVTGTIGPLMEYASIQLLIDRVRDGRVDFRLVERNMGSVVRLLQYLDGLPLAIELAASWLHLLAPSQVLARYENRLHHLEHRIRDIPERHHSLYEAILWSYNLLSETHQCVFRSLSVFEGEFDLRAVDYLLENFGEDRLPILADLSDRSLLVFVPAGNRDESSPATFRMLETVRYVARELLTTEEQRILGHRHATFYAKAAQEALVQIRNGREVEQGLHNLVILRRNLLAALEWCLSVPEDIEIGLDIGSAMWSYWMRKDRSEALRYLPRLLERDQQAKPSIARTNILNILGFLATMARDFTNARKWLQEADDIVSQRNRPDLVIGVRINRAWLATSQGDFDEACLLYQHAIALFDQENPKDSLAMLAACQLASLERRLGHMDKAQERLKRTIDISRREQWGNILASALANSGHICLDLQEIEEGCLKVQEALDLMAQQDDTNLYESCLGKLAYCRYATGDYRECPSLLKRALIVEGKNNGFDGIMYAILLTLRLGDKIFTLEERQDCIVALRVYFKSNQYALTSNESENLDRFYQNLSLGGPPLDVVLPLKTTLYDLLAQVQQTITMPIGPKQS